MVPAAIGVFLYKFSLGVKDVNEMLVTAVKKEDVDIYQYLIDNVLKNKEMIMVMIVFAIVILLTYFVYLLPFDYSWYVAIGTGGLLNVLSFMICGVMFEVEAEFGPLIFGSFVGILVTVVVMMCKRLVDYSRKEVVQFEDDDYYYYVKAIPKYGVSEKKKTVKKMTNTNTNANNKQGTNRNSNIKNNASGAVKNQNAARSAGANRNVNRNVNRTGNGTKNVKTDNK